MFDSFRDMEGLEIFLFVLESKGKVLIWPRFDFTDQGQRSAGNTSILIPQLSTFNPIDPPPSSSPSRPIVHTRTRESACEVWWCGLSVWCKRSAREGGVSAQKVLMRVSRAECGSRVVARQRVARRHPVHMDCRIVAARHARVRQGGGHPRKAVSALCLHPVLSHAPRGHGASGGVGTPSVDEHAYTARSGESCCSGGGGARGAGRESKRGGCARGVECQRRPSGGAGGW
ncbi:hypothetical protein B0H14DRAFT_2563153 [Mycena olivaceomarginata]|nr:hypothetical protein B0H14DRAFT_2563153 [Mycena olivaceomarginata]